MTEARALRVAANAGLAVVAMRVARGEMTADDAARARKMLADVEAFADSPDHLAQRELALLDELRVPR